MTTIADVPGLVDESWTKGGPPLLALLEKAKAGPYETEPAWIAVSPRSGDTQLGTSELRLLLCE